LVHFTHERFRWLPGVDVSCETSCSFARPGAELWSR
jgi:hypothetical protein